MTNPHEQMLAQLGALHDDMAQLPAEIRAALAASQAGYDALANDLAGVVSTEMHNVVQWRPSIAADDVDQGHFKSWNSIVDYLNARPRGSSTEVQLNDPNQVFEIDRDFKLEDRGLFIRRVTGDEVRIKCKDNGNGENTFYKIELTSGSRFNTFGVTFHFDALVFSGNSIAANAAFLSNSNHSDIQLSYTNFTCAEEGRLIFLNQWSGGSRIVFENVSINGNIEGVGGSSEAIALLSVRGGTFSNGATTHNTTAFTQGQNLLLT